MEKEAKERIADLKERDEYANRVRDRDKERTKKVMSKSEKKVHIYIIILIYTLCSVLCTHVLFIILTYKCITLYGNV